MHTCVHACTPDGDNEHYSSLHNEVIILTGKIEVSSLGRVDLEIWQDFNEVDLW